MSGVLPLSQLVTTQVLGGQVYVGRLDSRGPLLNWLPPAPLQQVQAAAAPAAMAAAAAAAPVPAPVLPPVAAAAAAVQQVAQQARVAVKEVGGGLLWCSVAVMLLVP